jgi:hypothetical protein
MPVENGPPAILHNFSNTIKEWGFQKPTPEEITQSFHVTKSIMEVIDGEPDENKRKRHLELLDEPLSQKCRQNATRVARYEGAYGS